MLEMDAFTRHQQLYAAAVVQQLLFKPDNGPFEVCKCASLIILLAKKNIITLDP